MKIYVQKEDGEFIDESAFAVYFGFKSMGYSVIPFEKCAPPGRKKRDLVYGKIGVVLDAISAIGVKPPDVVGIPTELWSSLGRKVGQSELQAIRESGQFPIFIKPLNENKLFHGHVVRTHSDLSQTAHLPDNTMVFTSEVVEFKAEYRGFVLNGKLVGCRLYKGEFESTPDFSEIKKAISKIEKPNVAYSIDVGVTPEGKTLIVELNDTYSLRSYGLPPRLFCEIIRKRWNEIVRNAEPVRKGERAKTETSGK